MAVILLPGTFRVCFLSSLLFELVTGHQTLQAAFIKKNTHSRMTHWLDLLSEYSFRNAYKSGASAEVADLLSKYGNEKSALHHREDKGNRAMVIDNGPEQLKSFEENIWKYLRVIPTGNLEASVRRGVKRAAKNFLLWKENGFRKTTLGPKVVVPLARRTSILNEFYEGSG